jgi:hypothetical protein
MPGTRSTTKVDLTPPKTELVTVRMLRGGYELVCTQDFITSADMGHYRLAVLKDGHLHDVYHTTGAPPRGKVTKAVLVEHYERFTRGDF